VIVIGDALLHEGLVALRFGLGSIASRPIQTAH